MPFRRRRRFRPRIIRKCTPQVSLAVRLRLEPWRLEPARAKLDSTRAEPGSSLKKLELARVGLEPNSTRLELARAQMGSSQLESGSSPTRLGSSWLETRARLDSTRAWLEPSYFRKARARAQHARVIAQAVHKSMAGSLFVIRGMAQFPAAVESPLASHVRSVLIFQQRSYEAGNLTPSFCATVFERNKPTSIANLHHH